MKKNYFKLLAALLILTWLVNLTLNWNDLKQNYYFKSNKQFMDYIDSYFTSTKQAQFDFLNWFSNKNHDNYLFSTNPNLNDSNYLCIGLITKERFSEQKYDYATQTLISLVTRTKFKYRNNISINLYNVNKTPFKLNKLFKVIDLSLNNNYYQHQNPKLNEALHYAQIMKLMYERKECKYALLLEDDSIAAFNWYDKLMKAIRYLEEKETNKEWMCLKLFTSFRYYDWLIHPETVLDMFVFIIIQFLVQFLIIKYFNYNYNTFMYALIALNILILKLFLNGSSVSPLGYGVKKYSQGFNTVAIVYPRDQLLLISNYLKDTVNNYVYNNKLFLAKDEAINKYRRENRLNEFILEPSLFQHVGIHSSLRQDIFNSDNNKRNVLDYQFGPFHSFSFMKEYGKMKISFDPIFWLS
jgi:hypothetical protein